MSDDFKLNEAQMSFMNALCPDAEQADIEDNYTFFDAVVTSKEWRELFGSMGWDQAYDRYELMLNNRGDND